MKLLISLLMSTLVLISSAFRSGIVSPGLLKKSILIRTLVSQLWVIGHVRCCRKQRLTRTRSSKELATMRLSVMTCMLRNSNSPQLRCAILLKNKLFLTLLLRSFTWATSMMKTIRTLTLPRPQNQRKQRMLQRLRKFPLTLTKPKVSTSISD